MAHSRRRPPPPPPTLIGLAADRWRAIVPTLLRRGPVDLSTVETYCQVWARWRDAESRISAIGPLVRRNNQPAPNPLIAVSNQAAVQARALEAQLQIGVLEGGRGAPLSMRQYAKRRGVSAEAVSKAIRDGRLRLSLTAVDGRPKIADPEMADREWRENTDASKAPDAWKTGSRGAASATLADAAMRERVARAQLAELDYETRAGALVSAREVERVWTALVVQFRTAILGIPAKYKSHCPELTHAQLATLNDLLRQALEVLAEEPAAARDEGRA